MSYENEKYRNEVISVELENPDFEQEGSVAVSYSKIEKDEAYKQILSLMRCLIDSGYECLIQDEGGVLVLSYCYDKWKAQEFGCASFRPIDKESYDRLVDAHKYFQYEKERYLRGDEPERCESENDCACESEN